MKLTLLSLLTLALATPVLRAADVDLYAVTKVQSFEQTSTAAPTLLPVGAFIFGALVTPNTATSVTSATLRLPSLVVKSFGPTPGFGPFGVSESFDSLAALTAVYGSGSYGFTINAVTDGTRTPTLSLTSSAYPNTPTVSNFTAAQNIDWTQDFTVTWGAYVGGGANDTIQLTVNRSNGTQVFATPSFGSPGALDSTATSVVIPANTFVPGQSYTATLAFGNVIAIDIFSYFTVPGVTALIKTTRFPIKAPGTTPALVISKGASAGSYDFTWNSDVGRVYDFTQSADLVSWTRVALVTATGTTTTRSVTPGAAVTSRFYRLQTPP